MKMCDNHMRALSKRITEKGMGNLMSDDPAEVTSRTRAWYAGRMSVEQFDPRVICHAEIFGKAKALGLNIPQDRCPLCFVEHVFNMRGERHGDDSWIDNVTDAVLLQAKVNDLA